MRRPFWAIAALVVLSGCRTNVYENYFADQDEWSIRGTSPGGMYGGFIGLAPSPDAVRDEAARVCPAGYDTLSQQATPFFEGKVFELRVRCHKQPDQNKNSN